MFDQVDGEGKTHVLFEYIIDHRNDKPEVKQQDAFIKILNGNKHMQ